MNHRRILQNVHVHCMHTSSTTCMKYTCGVLSVFRSDWQCRWQCQDVGVGTWSVPDHTQAARLLPQGDQGPLQHPGQQGRTISLSSCVCYSITIAKVLLIYHL